MEPNVSFFLDNRIESNLKQESLWLGIFRGINCFYLSSENSVADGMQAYCQCCQILLFNNRITKTKIG